MLSVAGGGQEPQPVHLPGPAVWSAAGRAGQRQRHAAAAGGQGADGARTGLLQHPADHARRLRTTPQSQRHRPTNRPQVI